MFFSFLLLFIFSPVLLFTFLLASWDTKSFGIFTQKRIGQWGKLFVIFKLKTIHPDTKAKSVIGSFFRKSKLDELPQLINILIGEMSFVGPRPDEVGYYDALQGEDRRVLALKPGLTSEASLKYSNEEYLLSQKENPLQYNDEVIFPDKVKMNLNYMENQSFVLDLKIILKTIQKIIS